MIAPANLGEVSGIWISSIWISESGFNPASGFQHLDFWFPAQFSGTSFFHQPDKYPKPDDLRSDLDQIDPSDQIDPDLHKKILLLISNNRFNFYGTFPYSWFEKFYRLLGSIVFLLIAVDFRNGCFLIIRRFRRHLFSILYTDRSGTHHLQ